jgi:hypothetical protein
MDASLDANFSSGDELMMMTSASNRHTTNTEDTFAESGHSHGMTASAALYYPSLIGNCWDDELLPSGD